MIYLKNKTLLQDVYIPRQDMLPYTTGSSGTYAEGYSDGYEDGTQDQKDKLASTAFTENGLYTREDGWNEVEVSVEAPLPVLEDKKVVISADTTTVTPSSGYYGMSAVTIDASEYGQSNYDEGFDDGYTDGYSSGTSDGEQSIIDTFTSTTITINGQYGSSANPYSSVTVNVAQTGHTDEELQEAYESGYTSGSTDGYNSGYTSGETHQKSLLVSTAFTQNGQYTSENGWNGVTVNIDTASTYNSGYTSGYTSGHTDGIDEEKAKMSAVTFTANTAVTLSDGSYSAVTVNVPQTGSTNSIISVTGNTWYVLDHYFGTGEQIEITNATFDYSVANGGRHQQLIAGGDGEWVRIGGNGDNLYTSYYGDSDIDAGPTILDDDHILLKNGAFYINDMETPVSTFGPYPLDIFKDTRMVVFANTASGGDSVCGQTASVGVITIYDENDNVVDKYIPELHNGVACFHNIISGNYITPSGTGTPTITNTDYNEGYIDGRQDVINTFTSTTATTNGVYGSSAHPLSSITVNVPQSGGSGVKYIEYLETDGTNIVYDTGIKITSNNVKIYLDYMRHSGSTEDYTGLVSQMYNDMLFSYLFFVPGNWNRDIIMPRFGGDNYELPSLLDTYYETVVSNTGTTINGVDYPHTFESFQETDEHMYLNAQHHYGSFRRFAIARYYRFAVESGGTLLVDMRPCLDENNIPCFYDEVSETYIYHTGTGTPIAGPVLDPSYASGYTDGYASGYTDGASSSQSDLSKLVDKSITQADLQSGCTKIGSYAFYMCSYLTGVTIPNTVTEIGQYAFQSCYRLNEVNIPDSVVYIRNNAFYGCEAISSVTFGNSIEQIGICAFQDCKSLTTASIPDSIRKISDGAFWGCTALTEVYIGSGITEFTAGAGTYGVFTGCDSLTDIYLYATTPPSYSQYTFTGVNHSITLHCPVGSDYSSYSIPSYWSIVYDL